MNGVDDWLAKQVSPARSRNMAANRRRDTGPELAVRRVLHRRGLRYRVDRRMVIGGRAVRPDIVFTRARIAVFIDGCFWHRCPEHGSLPKSNVSYWLPKLETNVRRDREQTGALEAAGWHVLRHWEHEDPADVASSVVAAVHRAQSAISAGFRPASDLTPVPRPESTRTAQRGVTTGE